MTDKEILKALEYHRKGLKYCRECPLQKPSLNILGCNAKLLELVVDIINRQHAEIERLKTKIKQQDEIISNGHFAKFYAHEHSLKNIEGYTFDVYEKAIKEFAERLKRDCTSKVVIFSFEGIDNLVKEMVGAEIERLKTKIK